MSSVPKSYQHILDDMLGKFLKKTPLEDLDSGSAIRAMLLDMEDNIKRDDLTRLLSKLDYRFKKYYMADSI